MTTIRSTTSSQAYRTQPQEKASTKAEQTPAPQERSSTRGQDQFVGSGTSSTKGASTPSPATLLAQAGPSSSQPQQLNVQTPFGNIRLKITENVFQAPDTGQRHQLNVLEIKRGDPQARPDFSSTGNKSDIDRLVNMASGWVNSGATISSLPGFKPETVQVTAGDNGVASMQRWMSNGREGRLVSVSVRDPRLGDGFIDVPPAVFNALPEGRGRDVNREGGTQYTLRSAQVQGNGRTQNATFWEASYLQRDAKTQQLERVTLQFTPGDNKLAVVTTQQPNGAITYDFREGYDRLPTPRNNLVVPSGSQVTYFSDGALLKNEQGTLREIYAKGENGKYELESRREHILSNGRSTDLRLLHNARQNTYQLARESNGALQLINERLDTTPQGQPIIPRQALTGLDPNTLSTPKTQLSVSSSRPATGPLQPRLVELDYNRFQYSQREGSLAERFRQPDAPFQQRTVVINGQERQMELLDGGSESRYVDRQGVEYIARQDGNKLHVENINPNSSIGSPARVYTLPPDTFIIPSGGARAKDLIPRLAAMGLEPVGILGTGFIGSEDLDGNGKVEGAEAKHKNVVGFSYFDPNKLGITQNIPAADRKDAPAFERRASGIFREGGVIREDGLGSDKIHAGYYTTFSRENGQLRFQTHRLEYPDTPGTGPADNDRQRIRADLQKLMDRPDVVAINLFAHHSSDKVEELVGIMEQDWAEPDHGVENVLDGPVGANGKVKDEQPTKTLDARAMMVYDNAGNQLGVMFVPKMAIRDTLEAARQAFNRPDVEVQNMDGDFYAQTWFPDGRDGSSNYALNYQDAFIVVRPTQGFKPAQVPPVVNDPNLDAQYERGQDANRSEDIRERINIPIIRDIIDLVR
jgi:hypothetical protein